MVFYQVKRNKLFILIKTEYNYTQSLGSFTADEALSGLVVDLTVLG